MKRLLPLVFGVVLALSAQAADATRFHTVSLLKYALRPLASYGPEQALSCVPRGPQEFGGVPFNLEAKLEFYGHAHGQDDRFHNTRVTGIPIGKQTARLHLLHGCNYAEAEGRPVATLTLHYAGGDTRVIQVQYGVHTRDWFMHPSEARTNLTDSHSAVAWYGDSFESIRIGSKHRLYQTGFELPLTDKILQSVDLYSAFNRASFCVFGLTTEDADKDTKPADDGTNFLRTDNDTRRSLMVRVLDEKGAEIASPQVAALALITKTSALKLGRFKPTAGGEVPVDFPARSQGVRLMVTAPGFAPKLVTPEAGSSGELAAKVTVKLTPGTEIGGSVRDENGKPVAHAKIEIFGARKDESGSTLRYLCEEVVTGRDGKWKSLAVATNFEGLYFAVTQPEFRPARFDQETETMGGIKTAALRTKLAEFSIQHLGKLAGTVKSAEGKPIAKAQVILAATWKESTKDQRKEAVTSTDASGRFSFNEVVNGKLHLLTRADGYGSRLLQLTKEDAAQPVEIILNTGRVIELELTSGEKPDDTTLAHLRFENSPDASFQESATISEKGVAIWTNAPTSAIDAWFDGPEKRSETRRIAAGLAPVKLQMKINNSLALPGRALNVPPGIRFQ